MAAGGLLEADVQRLIRQLGSETNGRWDAIANSSTFLALCARPAEQRPALIERLLLWLVENHDVNNWMHKMRVQEAMLGLVQRGADLSADQLMALISWMANQEHFFQGVPQVIHAVERFQKARPLPQPLIALLADLIEALQGSASSSDVRNWIARLGQLAGHQPATVPLNAGEAWADTARAEISAMSEAHQAAWRTLLLHCQLAKGGAPTARWLNGAQPALASIGTDALKHYLHRWFALVDQPRTRPITVLPQYGPNPNQLLDETNADILKGLAWRCHVWDDRPTAQALSALAAAAYRKAPGAGPRCPRLGNAAVWALGAMPGQEGLSQLAILRLKIKVNSVQKTIAKAMAAAAQRAGLSPAELEELVLPTYGLQQPGFRAQAFGEYTGEMQVTGKAAVTITWARPDGQRQTSTPAAVKAAHGPALKAFTQDSKDLVKMLPAQSDRLERQYLEQRHWRLPVWRERYLDHPVVGALARRLIWKFSRGDQAASGLWHAGQIVSHAGAPLAWLDDDTQVELWHPLQVPVEVVLAWRAWLVQQQITQPFKQAHREVYLLTEAERRTVTYSNRFAAHILRQHQFNALCAARGWHNKLRLMVDDVAPPASRALPVWGLRAEYWIEGAGDTYGTDTNETGTFHYVVTDQVRFYRLEASENYAHVAGGGYHMRGREGADSEPLPLEQVPPLVLSEIMRDVDLFVGVASVGNDPNWGDGGGGNRYHEYWHTFAFGDLSATAQTRRDILAGLLPRLKIADRCRLDERFLVVRGDRHTYHIHLGSSNIQMEPNNQYLCIVPGRGGAPTGGGPLFLPFEGDQTLAIILSKAFLLANDRAITDPTILRQL